MDQYKNFITETKDVKDALGAMDGGEYRELKEAFYRFAEGQVMLEGIMNAKGTPAVLKKQIKATLDGKPNFLGRYL